MYTHSSQCHPRNCIALRCKVKRKRAHDMRIELANAVEASLHAEFSQRLLAYGQSFVMWRMEQTTQLLTWFLVTMMMRFGSCWLMHVWVRTHVNCWMERTKFMTTCLGIMLLRRVHASMRLASRPTCHTLQFWRCLGAIELVLYRTCHVQETTATVRLICLSRIVLSELRNIFSRRVFPACAQPSATAHGSPPSLFE